MLLEQIRVGAHAFQDQAFPVDLAEQHPVRFDMLVAPARAVSGQLVIPANRIEGAAVEQDLREDLELLEALAALLAALDVFAELAGVNRDSRTTAC